MATGWTADEPDFEEAAKLMFVEIMTIDVAYIAFLFTQWEYDVRDLVRLGSSTKKPLTSL